MKDGGAKKLLRNLICGEGEVLLTPNVLITVMNVTAGIPQRKHCYDQRPSGTWQTYCGTQPLVSTSLLNVVGITQKKIITNKLLI